MHFSLVVIPFGQNYWKLLLRESGLLLSEIVECGVAKEELFNSVQAWEALAVPGAKIKELDLIFVDGPLPMKLEYLQALRPVAHQLRSLSLTPITYTQHGLDQLRMELRTYFPNLISKTNLFSDHSLLL